MELVIRECKDTVRQFHVDCSLAFCSCIKAIDYTH
jgi:hypothetical protein